MDMAEIISTQNAPAAIGPYSQAVKANGMLYTSGQIGIVPALSLIHIYTGPRGWL